MQTIILPLQEREREWSIITVSKQIFLFIFFLFSLARSLSSFVQKKELPQGSSLLFFLCFLPSSFFELFFRRRIYSRIFSPFLPLFSCKSFDLFWQKRTWFNRRGEFSSLSLLRFEPHLFLHLSMRFSRKSKTLLHFCSVNQSKLQGCTSPHSKTAVQTELYVFCSHQLVVVHSNCRSFSFAETNFLSCIFLKWKS